MSTDDCSRRRGHRRRRFATFGVIAGATLLAAAHGAALRTPSSDSPRTRNAAPHLGPTPARAGNAVDSTTRRPHHPGRRGIHKIRHVVIIMQENRSFDNYFGTYPGADGIPMRHGVPKVCVPDPVTKRCVRPYLNNTPYDYGGPHGLPNAVRDINGGRMNGFIAEATKGRFRDERRGVMAYHNARTVPNYWAYARHFVLNDHMFASNSSWSLTEHLYMVSEWSARCARSDRPRSCVSTVKQAKSPPDKTIRSANAIFECSNTDLTNACDRRLHHFGLGSAHRFHLRVKLAHGCNVQRSFRRYNDSYSNWALAHCERVIRHARIEKRLRSRLLTDAEFLRRPDYAWTDLTYLLHKHHVKWRYYVMNGTEPDCRTDSEAVCPPVKQDATTPGIWNPLPYFDTVRADHQLHNIRSLKSFYRAAHAGKLPAVSWIIPTGKVSEHPPSSVADGQAYVTGLINTIMRGPDWKSTAIFVSWDEWGGFYDHVRPPHVDRNGYGLRVPGLVISPYAKHGYVDHQTTSHDAYIKFIEDDFLGGARINPATDGRPDPRPDVRESLPQVGNLRADFNFKQKPRKPLIFGGAVVYWHGPHRR